MGWTTKEKPKAKREKRIVPAAVNTEFQNEPGTTAESTDPIADFWQQMAEEVCDEVSGGGTYRKACENRKLDMRRLWRVIQNTAENIQRYRRAREAQAERMSDEIIYIADTPQMGIEKTIKADGSVETKHGDMLGHRRLQVAARQWLMAKTHPVIFGDSPTTVNNIGAGAGATIVISPELRARLQERRRLALLQQKPLEKPANASHTDIAQAKQTQ